jgi:putative transposase
MKARQHTAEQIIKILEQAEKGDQTIGAVCRTNGIAENTFISLAQNLRSDVRQ